MPQRPQPARLRGSFESAMESYKGSLLDLPLVDEVMDAQPQDNTSSEILLSDDEAATFASEDTTLVDACSVGDGEREN